MVLRCRAAFGHAKVQGESLLLKGLSRLISVIRTPLGAPVLGRSGCAAGTAPPPAARPGWPPRRPALPGTPADTGKIVVRMDPAYYKASVIGTIRRNGAHFSVTVPVNSSIRSAIAGIGQDAWMPIAYSQAIWDDQLDCWASDAEVAETGYTAFASKKIAVTARLIVRRARARNEKAAEGLDELFPAWRYHAFSPTRRLS